MWAFYFHTFNLKSHFFFYPENISPHYFLNSFLLPVFSILFFQNASKQILDLLDSSIIFINFSAKCPLCPFFSFVFRLPWHQFPTLVFFSFLWVLSVTCGILVPQLRIEPLPPALEGQSPNHWTLREAPNPCLFNLLFYFISDLLYIYIFQIYFIYIYIYIFPWWLRW